MNKEVINLDDCCLSRKNGMYGGAAGSKEGIIYNGEYWMIKYPKNIAGLERTGDASYSTSPLSEYLGSHIYDILGFDVHQTILAERHGKIVVACKDFAIEDDLIEIRTIKNYENEELTEILGQSFSSTGSEHAVDLKELLLHLKYNKILNQVNGIEERFWEQAVVDIFINNNDRNNGNWGILRNQNGEDCLAPVFDNGGSFQTKISENKIARLLSNAELLEKNSSNTQTTYGENGHLYSSQRFLDLYKTEPGLHTAILRIIPRIEKSMNRILQFIESVPEVYHGADKDYTVCSANRKELYSVQLQARLKNLLLPYYNKAKIFEEKAVEGNEIVRRHRLR